MKPLPLEEREYRYSLLRTERRAILPIKWLILIVTFLLWLTLVGPQDDRAPLSRPNLPLLILFGLYSLFNLIETYVVYFGAIGLKGIKPVTLVSYLADVVFVSMLIFYDVAPYMAGESAYSNFYILYFLLVMRGFALFKTVWETLLVNALISMLFVLTLRVQRASFSFVTEPEFAVQFILIWLVVLMAWFIMVVLNQQKLDLVRVHDQLVRRENLARVGELAAGVAHEINNPLGIITETAEYLKRCTDADDPRSEDIEAIARESNRCRDIVQQMLAYANPRPADLSVLDPTVLNDEVLQFIFPNRGESEIEIVKDYESHVPLFRADPNLLKQALLNLYLNAKQALPEGVAGRIVARIYGKKHPATVTFEIEDNGVGIDPEDIDRVFDPFFTRKDEGTGLGLSMTQKIVESFEGTISLEPVKPRGTLVRLQFPQAQA